MITYPLTFPGWPTPKVTTTQFGAQDVIGSAESPFTLEPQHQRHQGQRWLAAIGIPSLTRSSGAAELQAFLLSLRGTLGTYLLGDVNGKVPLGAGGGTPLVDGAAQVGDLLNTKGWPITTLVLKANDYCQLGSVGSTRLHRVLTDTTSDGAGLATLDIWPALRESPADSAAIVITNTQGLWRLARNSRDLGSLDLDAFYKGLTIEAVEAI